MVVGPQSYHKIRDLILDYERKKEKISETEFDVVGKFDELKKISNSQNKISSYLTIQEGCDKFCHFCVVPYTRGPEYSRPFEQIIDEAQNLVSNGAKEIILLGQNVNAYNYNKKYTLSSLIRALSNIKNLKRIRFITSHPKDMTEDLIDCYRDCKKLMPLLHLPIQSGSNKILKLMNRKHGQKYYMSVVEKLKKVNKDIKISSDFIVGYPGETERDFKDTIKLVKKIGFINSYSFIFSPRPGTPAASKKLNNLTEDEKRLKKLQNILENFQNENNKKYLQQNCEVLIENKLNNQKKYFGRTKHMTPVIFEADNCKIGELVNVKIISFNQKNLFGIYKTNKMKAA
jgi:tRNA-2-methylthio-N6-dimethylallyladenosine synthase